MLKNCVKKKVQFINNNRKGVLSFFLLFGIMVMLSVGYFGFVLQSVSKFNGVTIVLDAGHGGLDVK